MSELGVKIAINLSQVLGLSSILGTSDGWPFLLGVAFVPAVLQLMLLPFCPESPRYLLITKGRVSDARHALTRLRCTSNVEEDMDEMRTEESRAIADASTPSRQQQPYEHYNGHQQIQFQHCQHSGQPSIIRRKSSSATPTSFGGGGGGSTSFLYHASPSSPSSCHQSPGHPHHHHPHHSHPLLQHAHQQQHHVHYQTSTENTRGGMRSGVLRSRSHHHNQNDIHHHHSYRDDGDDSPSPPFGRNNMPTVEKPSVWGLISNPTLRRPLIVAVVIQLSQQLSGINAILYYSTDLFEDAGLQNEQARYATIGVGGVMVLMCLVSIPLMDKMGRRTLHLWGLGGMFIASIFFTISLLVRFLYAGMTFVSIVSLLLFVAFFAVGPGEFDVSQSLLYEVDF